MRRRPTMVLEMSANLAAMALDLEMALLNYATRSCFIINESINSILLGVLDDVDLGVPALSLFLRELAVDGAVDKGNALLQFAVTDALALLQNDKEEAERNGQSPDQVSQNAH